MTGEAAAGTTKDVDWRGIDIAPVAEAAWRVARAERSARFHHLADCPTRTAPYGRKDPDGTGLHPACQETGCLDLHHDLIERMVNQLTRYNSRHPDRTVKNLPAYLARVARSQLSEQKRAERVRIGAQAKPTRNDGAAGRVVARFESLGDLRREWLTRLFRIMRSYPFTPAHVPGRWPVDGLVEERAKLPDGHIPSREEIKKDIAFVTDIARRTLGPRWVHENLTTPLLSNGTFEELREEHAATDIDLTSVVLGKQLVALYKHLRIDGLSRPRAFQLAADKIGGHAPDRVTPDILTILKDLDTAG